MQYAFWPLDATKSYIFKYLLLIITKLYFRFDCPSMTDEFGIIIRDVLKQEKMSFGFESFSF